LWITVAKLNKNAAREMGMDELNKLSRLTVAKLNNSAAREMGLDKLTNSAAYKKTGKKETKLSMSH
jgi:hypothetical protein